jgi:membrane protease subunit (stomatin/prohibitin family)
MHMKRKTFLFASMVSLLVGCANPGIVKVSNNTYMLSKEDHAGMFGNAARLQANVIAQADTFAESQGKVAVGVSTQSIPAGPGRFASFSYEFRVVDKDDSMARNGMLVARPDLIVQNNQAAAPAAPTQSGDVYTKLTQLNDLLQRGIITQAEFDEQKKKILGEN